MNRLGAVALAAWIGMAADPLAAQQTIEYASVSGRLADASGAAVPGATVGARHVDTNVAVETVTAEDGRYRLTYLRVGSYEVSVRMQGFRDVVQRVTLTAGAAFDLPLSLQLAGVNTTVIVSADAPLVETARSQIATTVPSLEAASLPMNGRQFLELALLVPGVSPTNVGSSQQFPETSAVPGMSLSIGSQRNLSNNFVVDGLSANDDAAGLSGITYSVDAIEQFQVVTSGAQAELGRALGGYINVVTKSGTNVLRGTAYQFLRNRRLNAPHPLIGRKLPMRQRQFGGSVGGPIIANRTFYFANAERRILEQAGLVTIAPVQATIINARLADAGYAGPLVATGGYRNPVRSTNALLKVAHQVGGGDQLSVRYSAYTVAASNARGAGGLSAPSASADLDNADQSLALGNTWPISGTTVLETRAQVVHGSLQAPPSDLVGPAVSIAGVATFGRASNSPTGRVNTMYQLVNNVTHYRNAHALKAGVDMLHNSDRITFPRSTRGAYTFASLATFIVGTYNNAGFTQTFGADYVEQSNPNLGMYLQDEWTVGSGVTVNLGVRYDLQSLETITTDRNNVSPRIGVVWSPFVSGRSVIRAAAGLFYDRVPLRAVANALLSAGNTTDVTQLRQINVSLSPSQAGAPLFPHVLDGPVASVTLPNLTTMDRDLQNAYSRQFSMEVEQQLGSAATASVGYQYLRGVGLLMSVNQNVPSCVAAGANNGCRPNSTYANNSQYSSVGESNYHGLHLAFVQRPARWGHYRVSYTLSTSMNNVGEFFFSSPIDPFDLSKDWGRSDDDQRHRLVVSGSAETSSAPAVAWWQHLTHHLQASAMVQAYSALPLNVASGVTTTQGTAGRPMVNGAFIERNAGEGSDFFSLGSRVSRTFEVKRVQLEAMVEGFNLTNRVNALTRNGTFGSGAFPGSPLATFRQITAVNEPRALQLAVRASF